MTLKSFVAMLRRFIWLVVIGVVLAGGAGAAGFLVSPKGYEMTARFLLLSPLRNAEGQVGNPFLDLGNGVASLAEVVSTSLTDDATVLNYRDKYPGLEYAVARDVGTNAPVIIVKVDASKEAEAKAALEDLSEAVPGKISDLQKGAGAPQNLWVTSTTLTRDTRAKPIYTVPLRTGISAGAGVLLVDLLIVALLERRRARRAATASAGAPAAVPTSAATGSGTVVVTPVDGDTARGRRLRSASREPARASTGTEDTSGSQPEPVSLGRIR
ncbi:hypothetical protein [Sinomonas sp. ASV322]|uniref:hypothetical protein n=1 Tax=Sinomonas sp. ASV322 TaxID=3041920 RepID=UPI0027DCEC0C|nr:hypothetical protein [Sinomonas sp. ASV322]MDQ4504341.1 hypothetical protein [Sinomonas sp. ASV322]